MASGFLLIVLLVNCPKVAPRMETEVLYDQECGVVHEVKILEWGLGLNA